MPVEGKINTVIDHYASASNGYQQKETRNKIYILDLEIDDHGMAVCHTGICQPYPQDITLLRYNEIPHFLKGNPWVISGYRALLPFGLCLKSVLIWNNETVNIWSHLLALLLFLILMLYDNLISIPKLKGGFVDHVIISLGLLCYQFCLACSTGFHIFCCHSERASRRWLQIDLTGISVGIIGCYIPAIHYGFYCISMWQDIYMIAVTLLTVSTVWFQLHPHFFSSRWHFKRVVLYVGLAAYGIIPSVHWIYLNDGLSSHIVQSLITKTGIMYLMGAVAFTFYISKFPERFFPGTFDIIGSSHQCWHVVVVMSMLWWRDAVLYIVNYRLASNTCSVPSST